MLRFRRLLWMPLLAVMFVVFPASHGFSQSQNEDLNIGDEPGLVPDESVQLPPQFQRQMVLYRTTEPPGTIIVHTSERFLYLVQGNGRAIRYGVRVGREGFQWQGLLKITRKAEWPDWTPPPEMIQRQPYLPRFMAAAPAIRSARGRCISARPSIAFTAPTSPTPSARPYRRDVSGWSMPTSSISTAAFRSAPRSSSGSAPRSDPRPCPSSHPVSETSSC